jgi:hypothetical protein
MFWHTYEMHLDLPLNPGDLRASPTIPQTSASNLNIWLYTEKNTSTVPHFIKFDQKI